VSDVDMRFILWCNNLPTFLTRDHFSWYLAVSFARLGIVDGYCFFVCRCLSCSWVLFFFCLLF
jgi:hypothetical protein